MKKGSYFLFREKREEDKVKKGDEKYPTNQFDAEPLVEGETLVR